MDIILGALKALPTPPQPKEAIFPTSRGARNSTQAPKAQRSWQCYLLLLTQLSDLCWRPGWAATEQRCSPEWRSRTSVSTPRTEPGSEQELSACLWTSGWMKASVRAIERVQQV